MKRFDHDKLISEALTKTGAFFAFSKKQLDENRQDGVEYCNMGHGLICPKKSSDQLFELFESAQTKKIEWELEHNSKKDIIWYELANHECQIVGDYSSVVELLEPYGITEEEIRTEWGPYFNNCVENDYF